MQEPKVAVSVFNTLNTIDWSSWGVMRNGRITMDSERFGVKPGEERILLGLNTVPSSRFVLLCITGVAILQMIKSRYVGGLSQKQLDLLFQRLELQPLKAAEMTLLIADVLLQGLLCCSLNTQPLNRPLFPQ